MKKLGEAVRDLRKQQGKTLAEVADMLDDYDAGNLSRFERGLQSITREKLDALAKALGTTVSKIYTLTETTINQANQELANYEGGIDRQSFGTVPLISWVQAGMYSECIDDLGECEKIITNCEVRKHTFALMVKGDSMKSDGNISFPEGIIIIVEPEMQAENGDFVIAKNGDNEATFKQLVKDGTDWYLKPLNDRYPIKPLGESIVIGVVRQSVQRFR